MRYLDKDSDITNFIRKETLFEPLDKNFWQEEMAQNYENILDILNNKEELQKTLKKQKVETFTLELLYLVVLGKNINPENNSQEIIEELIAEILHNKKFINIIGLICFLDGMRNDGLEYMAETLLTEEEINFCKYSYMDQEKADLTSMALLIFCKNPELLHMLEASEIIMSRKFEDYVMVKNITDEDISINKDELNEILTEGIDCELINEEYIEEVLSKVESRYNNFDSKFIGSFKRNNKLFAILFREYKEGKLRTLNNAIIANEAEIVVLSFGHRLRFFSIIAHENNIDFAVEIGNEIIIDKGTENIEYIQASEYVSEENIKKLLTVL
ncbi:MAG: hypothetical protein ACOCRX_09245 [Candidatus Woesearchaeota archaeon]